MTELDKVMRGPMEDTRAIALLLHAKLGKLRTSCSAIRDKRGADSPESGFQLSMASKPGLSPFFPSLQAHLSCSGK